MPLIFQGQSHPQNVQLRLLLLLVYLLFSQKKWLHWLHEIQEKLKRPYCLHLIRNQFLKKRGYDWLQWLPGQLPTDCYC
jgi:hypothetical protein